MSLNAVFRNPLAEMSVSGIVVSKDNEFTVNIIVCMFSNLETLPGQKRFTHYDCRLHSHFSQFNVG